MRGRDVRADRRLGPGRPRGHGAPPEHVERGGGPGVTRVVITSVGAVTPVGNDAESTWQGLRAGRSGVKRIDTFDVSTFPVQIAGMCSDFTLDQLPDQHAARYLHRGERFGVAAAAEAVRNAGIEDGPYEAEEIGVAIGGSVDRPELQEFSDAFAV